jgi:glucokinase
VRGKVAEPTAKEGDHGALAAQIIRLVGQSCAIAGVAVTDIAAVGVASCGPFVMRDGLVELAAPNICGGGKRWRRRTGGRAPLGRPAGF